MKVESLLPFWRLHRISNLFLLEPGWFNLANQIRRIKEPFNYTAVGRLKIEAWIDADKIVSG